ncbi:acyl-CoA dehydrogenase family protein [Microbacterium sp. BWT-B31]|uniref:acyl-CoA dehydrogenase family protein n=1 Tax=Microbacterium sp. BWT-B31 TaxID=3232072 RepID=UPI0035278D24
MAEPIRSRLHHALRHPRRRAILNTEATKLMKPTTAIEGYRSGWRDEVTEALYEVAADFFERTLVANREKYEKQHMVDREVWLEAGELGLLCCSVPEEYGGGGGTIEHDLAVVEAQSHSGDLSWVNAAHSGIVAHYLVAYGTEDQKRTWLPRMASGEVVGAIAMTEPAAGSDLKNIRTRAVRDGDEYVIDGSKIFISNGQQADLFITAVKTGPGTGARGISMLLVEADRPGFSRGRNLDKIGQLSADTSELTFEGVRVPVSNLLGATEGQGFAQMMAQLPQERLFVGMSAVAITELALSLTTRYTKEREAFGGTIWDLQNTQFTLAEVATEAHVARVFLDSCIERSLDGTLDTTAAAMLKYWTTDLQCSAIDRCLQFFGGYGYMREYQIARLYQDARVQRIYGGSNEVMKLLVARAL